MTRRSSPRSTTTLAAQPDVLEKIREGKVHAAGAAIGAVMKAMAGKADAACVRELMLDRAGSRANRSDQPMTDRARGQGQADAYAPMRFPR